VPASRGQTPRSHGIMRFKRHKAEPRTRLNRLPCRRSWVWPGESPKELDPDQMRLDPVVRSGDLTLMSGNRRLRPQRHRADDAARTELASSSVCSDP
jgi:hypothetical protein